VVTIIRPVWRSIIVVGFGQNEDIVTTAERVLEDGCGTKVDVRVMTRCLAGRRTVKVPYAELTYIVDFLATSGGFRTKTTVTIDPNV